MVTVVRVFMFLAVTCAPVLGDRLLEIPGDGYEPLSGLGWYKLHGEKKPWHDAVKVCEDEGSHLAIVNSNEEAMALKRLMSRHREVNYGVCGCVFLGFHDLSKEGHFVTVLGDPLEGPGFLKPKRMDNSGNNEDCGSLSYLGELNDLSCVEPYPFICEHLTDSNRIRNGTVDKLHPMYLRYPNLGSYKLHTDIKTWNDAKQVCDKEGAYLAIVNSEEESDVLRKMIGRNPDLELGVGETAFVGIYAADNKNFLTIFGDPVGSTGFDEWASTDRGNDSRNTKCGGITRNGRLSGVPCLTMAPFFCERYDEDDKPSTVLEIADPATQDGYSVFPGVGAYKLHMDATNWHEAKRRCEQENAYLAIINTLKESHTLRDMVANPKINMKNYWSIHLGFHDLSTEGHFITIFNESLESTGFTQWFGLNPDNFGPGEDCGSMKRNGQLNDVPCDMRLPYMCERDIGLNKIKRQMTVYPEHVHVRQGSLVSVMCQSDEPLIECHFKILHQPIYDLSLGQESKTNANHLTGDISMYRYEGTGLQNGQCGIVLSLAPGVQRKMVGCRGRAKRGGWKYGYMSLQASNSGAIDKISVPPREVIASQTEDIHLLCQTSPISTCKFMLPDRWSETVFTDSSEAQSSEEDSDSSEERNIFFGGYRPDIRTGTDPIYFGQGFNHGDCGVSLPRSPRWNGLFWCGLGHSSGFEWRAMSVIIPKAPQPPMLRVNAEQFSDRSLMEAECVVGGSRPVANITWYLGDDVIRQDNVDDSPADSWAWPHDEQIITQKLTRQLKLEDNGKKLTCKASHFALPDGSVSVSKPITIERYLLNRTFDVDEFGFEVGKQGFISVLVITRSKPILVWHFDDVTIQEAEQDPTGRFLAAQAVPMSSSALHWVAKLIISNVTEEDFKRDFYITARNDFGAQAYKIHIFKRPKSRPEGGQTGIETTTRALLTTTTTRTPWTTTSTTKRTTTGQTTTSTTTPLTTVMTPRNFTETTYYNEEITTRYVTDSESTGDSYTATTLVTKSQEESIEAQIKVSDSLSSGAIVGIVFAIFAMHLSLAAILVYGRRSGWWCIPGMNHGILQHSLSIENFVNEDESNY